MGKSWFNRFCVFQRNKSRQRFMKYCKTQMHLSVGCSGITTFLKLCFYSFLIVFFMPGFYTFYKLRSSFDAIFPHAGDDDK